MNAAPYTGAPHPNDETPAPMQIGDVAERTGLSLRTIRYYEEAGLVTPSTRTNGGFRLYAQADCERLEIVRRIKPLGFSLDEVRELLDVLDRLTAADATSDPATAAVLAERLEAFTAMAEERCGRMHDQLAEATAVTTMLKDCLGRSDSQEAGDTGR